MLPDYNIAALLTTLFTTMMGTFGGWFFGRKKQRAETSIIQIQALDAIRQFYEKLLADNNNKLDYYIKVSDANRRELHALKKIVDRLIDDACLKKGCNMRLYYSQTDMEEIDDTLNPKKEE